jgi:hypothetical protein
LPARPAENFAFVGEQDSFSALFGELRALSILSNADVTLCDYGGCMTASVTMGELIGEFVLAGMCLVFILLWQRHPAFHALPFLVGFGFVYLVDLPASLHHFHWIAALTVGCVLYGLSWLALLEWRRGNDRCREFRIANGRDLRNRG